MVICVLICPMISKVTVQRKNALEKSQEQKKGQQYRI